MAAFAETPVGKPGGFSSGGGVPCQLLPSNFAEFAFWLGMKLRPRTPKTASEDKSKHRGLPVGRFFGEAFADGALPAGEWATGATGKVAIKACWEPHTDSESGLSFEIAKKGTGLGSKAPLKRAESEEWQDGWRGRAEGRRA